MPTIKFKLKDPKKCDGCVCLKLIFPEGIEKGLLSKGFVECPFKLFKPFIYNKIPSQSDDRPKGCIDKFGE